MGKVSSPAEVSKSTRHRAMGPATCTNPAQDSAARSAASTKESGSSVGWEVSAVVDGDEDNDKTTLGGVGCILEDG